MHFARGGHASSGLPVSFQILSGPATISANTVTITGAGAVTVRASQPGDSNYNPAPPVDQPFTVAKSNQTISFDTLASKTFGNSDFAVSATASSGLSVSFAATGNCTVTGATVHLTSAGSCTITASQVGNANFNAAANVPQSFNIAEAATATIVSSSVNPSALSQSVAFTATVTSGAGTPTGTVQFKDNGTNLDAAQSLNGSGVAVLATSALTAGTHTITAHYSGDVNFLVRTDAAGTRNRLQPRDFDRVFAQMECVTVRVTNGKAAIMGGPFLYVSIGSPRWTLFATFS